jgi:hypothetical protein
MTDETDDTLREGDASTFDTDDVDRSNLSDVFDTVQNKGWLHSEPTPLKPLVTYDEDPWMPRGKVASLIAPGSTGKSQFLLQLAMCIASDNEDRQFLDTFDVPERGPVVLALGEESDRDIHRRMVDVFEAWELDPTSSEARSIGQNLYALGMADRRTALMSEPVPIWQVEDEASRVFQKRYDDPTDVPPDAADEIRAELLEGWTDQKRQWSDMLESPPSDTETPDWKAIMLDPASQFIGPEVETDAASATRFVQLLHTWAKRTWGNEAIGPTVLTAHHASQSAGEAPREDFLCNPYASRGTTALTDGVRWQANMYAEDADVQTYDSYGNIDYDCRDVVSLQVNKFNDGAAAETVYMCRNDSVVLEHLDEDRITFDNDQDDDQDE